MTNSTRKPKSFLVWVNDREKIISVKSVPEEIAKGYVKQEMSIDTLMQFISSGYKIG